MLCGQEGNRSVALAMHHRLQWFIHLRAQRPRKGRWAPHLHFRGAWSTLPFTLTQPLIIMTISVIQPMCVYAAARGTDSPAAGPALCAVHAAMLQPATSTAAVITTTANVRVGSQSAEPVTRWCLVYRFWHWWLNWQCRPQIVVSHHRSQSLPIPSTSTYSTSFLQPPKKTTWLSATSHWI